MLYSIIVPTYNQAENLPILIFLIEQVRLDPFMTANQSKLQVIIIEDNSPDGTLAIAKKLQTMYEHLRIIILQRPGKLGLGSAYRDGLKKAKGEFVILMDADLSHHPKYILPFIKKQQETQADIISSTRYVKDGGVYGWSFMRKLTSRVANFIASWTLGSSFSDLTGSYRLYRKQTLEELMGLSTTKGYAFQMQMLIQGWKTKKRIEEEPIVFVDRIYGKSKLGPNEVFIYLMGVGKLFLQY